MKRIAICSIGNSNLGDQGIAREALVDLGSFHSKENFLIIDCGREPRNYSKKIIEFSPDRIFFISAIDMSKASGTVESIEISKALKILSSAHRMKEQLFVDHLSNVFLGKSEFIAVQEKNRELGSGISPESRVAVTKIRELVNNRIKSL